MSPTHIETRLRKCSVCNGSGSNPFSNEDCAECVGTGFVPFGIYHNREITAEEYLALVRKELYKGENNGN